VPKPLKFAQALAVPPESIPVRLEPSIAGKAPVRLAEGRLVKLVPTKEGAVVLVISGVLIPVVPFNVMLILLPT
tara:strand:+ start:609 stop:830 length:222 start_codon:yes stop_codon:yes gene_type:complete